MNGRELARRLAQELGMQLTGVPARDVPPEQGEGEIIEAEYTELSPQPREFGALVVYAPYLERFNRTVYLRPIDYGQGEYEVLAAQVLDHGDFTGAIFPRVPVVRGYWEVSFLGVKKDVSVFPNFLAEVQITPEEVANTLIRLPEK